MKNNKGGKKKGGKKNGTPKKKGGGGSQKPLFSGRGREVFGPEWKTFGGPLESVIPEAERAFVAGYGNMMTASWLKTTLLTSEPLTPMLVELTRKDMQRYKVKDVQSKASLLRILGVVLLSTGRPEVKEEGLTCLRQAFDLIRSEEKRSIREIVFGVWPESFVMSGNLVQFSPDEQKEGMDYIRNCIILTRRAIEHELERTKGKHPRFWETMDYISRTHYETELRVSYLLLDLDVKAVQKNFTESARIVAKFEKRVEKIEKVFRCEGWNLDIINETKRDLIVLQCNLYQCQGNLGLALQLVEKLMELDENDSGARYFHAILCFKDGQVNESVFESMEAHFAACRLNVSKAKAAKSYSRLVIHLPDSEECKSRFDELIPHYPHVLWAANLAGDVELSEQQTKAMRQNLVAKSGGFCINCYKELTKVYRCSRCNVATYCGSACQKEAWKEHKTICKKPENEK
jgi:hypothetical protein